jgi:quinol-cytochrome oxidoreductase complex cytochrome b subunit
MDEKTSYQAGIGSNALKEPKRVVFITNKTSAKVKGEVGKQKMSYPHLLLRETIVFQVVTVVLVILALVWDAPLEQLANPLLTPNPAKAPWYFLGLQELLHDFPPFVAGILIPGLVVLALVVIPYFNVNVTGEALWASNRRRHFGVFLMILAGLFALFGAVAVWTLLLPTAAVASLMLLSYFARPGRGRLTEFLRLRPISWWVMSWFIVVAIVLTVVGTFFRGPGWSWVWPWRPYEH